MDYVDGSAWLFKELEHRRMAITGLYRCSQCAAPSIGTVISDATNRYDLVMANRNSEPYWLPEAASGKEFPEVPGPIASAADEAHRCHSIQAYRGAIALARAALEATAKERGYTTGSLQQKIDAMTKDGLLRKNINDAADQLRQAGNHVLHADEAANEVDSATEDDADSALWLLDQVLQEVYQSTARLAKIKQSAETAKARQAEAGCS